MLATTPEQPASPVHEKRSKKEKSKKKRSRDDESDDGHETSQAAVDEKPHKHRKSKGDASSQDDVATLSEDGSKKREKKHKKSKSKEEGSPAPEDAASSKPKKTKSRKDPDESDQRDNERPTKEEKKKRKRSKETDRSDKVDSSQEADPFADGAMDVDRTTSGNSSASVLRVPDGAPENPEFPFYSQTISLYVPLYPVGFDAPITKALDQHLVPFVNHYSPTLKGVLLGYSNACLAERPTRGNPKNPPTDQTRAVLQSIDEYAVGFGWLTADVDLFVPRRGAWMEGVMNLQSEGHIGVVCWNKFNASIEAKRLPQGWRWVDLAEGANEQAEDEEEDFLDDEHLQVEQMHATGHWVDGSGRKIRGRLRFRIKNFDVGLAGEFGYLSIEGTMLDEETERDLATEERETARRHKLRNPSSGYLHKTTRRVPEFSMTRFGREDEDSQAQKPVVSKSRPSTPDD